MPKVSIIIPTYNRSDYLAEALNSCLDQTHKAEIVVVNDGSTDSTDKLMDFYLKKHDILYLKKENGGPASAMNYGIERCSGDILTFAAADDIQLPDKVQISREAVEGYGFAYSGYYHCNTLGERWNYVPPFPFTEDNIRACRGPSGGALVMWRKTWEQIPFRDELRLNEDLGWAIDAFKRGLTWNMVDKPTFRYRMLKDGLSYSRKKEVDKTTKKLLKEFDE